MLVVGSQGIEPQPLDFQSSEHAPAIRTAHIYWWTFTDLNRGQTGYEPVALTNWAKGPYLLVVRVRFELTKPEDARFTAESI